MMTSPAWNSFLQSHKISKTQIDRGGGDSDAGDEDGFVGTKNEETMMQIMDKYVQAGEALAWKDSEVRDLKKQVAEVKAVNNDLEARVSHLTTSNEKLLDSEGRWYSLARELENQMDVIKKGETYSLFQDKVDEAEARLEVATHASNTCRRRLFEVYSLVNSDFHDTSVDNAEEDVDEHRLHASILDQLQQLKSTMTGVEDALAASRDASSAAELARQQAQAQEEMRNQLELQVAELREQAWARDAAAQAEQGALRDALAKQAQEVSQALQEASRWKKASLVAEDRAKNAEDAGRAATDALRHAKLEVQSVEGCLAEARSALSASQEEAKRCQEAQNVAESNMQQMSGRVVELEKLLKDAHLRSAELERDLAGSSHEISELSKAVQMCQREVAEAKTKSCELQAYVETREQRLRESLERATGLSDNVETLRTQLDVKSAAANLAQSEVERASRDACAATERAEGLRQELERLRTEQAAHIEELRQELEVMKSKAEQASHNAFAASENAEGLRLEVEKAKMEASATARELAAQVEGLREESERAIAAKATAAAEQAAHIQDLRQELEVATNAAATAMEEGAARAEGLRQELASALAAATSAAQDSDARMGRLRQDLADANAALVDAQETAACAEGLRQELDRANMALSRAQDRIALLDEARLLSEASAEGAKRGRINAEVQISAIREIQALEEAHAVIVGEGGAQAEADCKLLAAEQAAATAMHELAEAKEELLRAEARLTDADLAREQSRQHASRLENDVHDLEVKLSEARASAAQLGEKLVATQTQLDAKTAALARAEEVSASNRRRTTEPTPGTAGTIMDPSSAPFDAEAVSSSSPPEKNTTVSNGGGEGASAMGNGVIPARSAEGEQLQAHAEAMELELRYTLESFEGQLSAMAREKVAIQKQVKELTGQCTTLRKQVSHYKKVAKESEAHVEQMLELQQQLCDAEGVAEGLRNANSDLRGVNRDLVSKLEVLRADGVEAHETKDEMIKLRARLSDAEEELVAKSHELAAKINEVASARTRASTAEQRLQQVESKATEMKDACQSTADELASSLTEARELRRAVSKVAELAAAVDDLRTEKHEWENAAASLTRQHGELEQAVRVLEEEKASLLQEAQQAEERQTILVEQLENIANMVGCEYGGGEGATSYLSISERIARIQRRLVEAEDLLQATARSLQQTAMEGDVELESGSNRIIDGISSLQRRLRVAESKVSQRPETQDGAGFGEAANVLEDLSVVLECDQSRVAHKVHELHKLTHELYELRDEHLKEIQLLKERVTSTMANPTYKEMSMGHMFPGGEVAAAREEIAALQVKIDTLKHELVEAQQTRVKDAEKHRREEIRLRERLEAFACMTEGANAVGAGHCLHERSSSLHRKSNSWQLGASWTGRWLSELAEQGRGAEQFGNTAGLPGPANGRSRRAKNEPRTNGDAFADGHELGSEDNHMAVAAPPGESTPTAVLAEIQATLGCTVDEVLEIVREQQAGIQQRHSAIKILGDLKHSYFNNMDSLASACGQEAARKVAPLFAQASELCSSGACLSSTQEGLEVLDEATSILADFLLQKANIGDLEMAEVALRKAKEEVATLKETLRRERLMMMAFRRWGHFYLALSNEALRRRTKEQNHARSQRDPPEEGPLNMKEQPRTERGRSRHSSSAGRKNGGAGRLQLSTSDLQTMVDQEARSVASELAGEPPVSLLALTVARKEMDDMAMKAQATLGVVYAQPPLTQDVSVATDQAMVWGTELEENIQNEVLSPDAPSGANFSASGNSAHVMSRMEAMGGDNVAVATHLTPLTVVGRTSEQQQQKQRGELSDLPGQAAGPKKLCVDSSSANEAPTRTPRTSLSASLSPTPLPTGPAGKFNGALGSNGTKSGRSSGAGTAPTVNAHPGRATGPLVENGISKQDRADFLKKQREERKASRRRSMDIRNRRTSAPKVMPVTVDSPSGFKDTRTSAPPPRDDQGGAKSVQAPPIPSGAGTETEKDNRRTSPPIPSTGSASKGDEATVSTPPDPAESFDEAVRPPPPFFNPTAVPPPLVPPNSAASAHAQPPKHPSIAFNVNETVEKALTDARLDARLAERGAAFWKCRFRDLVVWSASFVVLAYASDHGFEDC